MKGKGIFVVRAIVPDAQRGAFDEWYRVEHLPDAVRSFGAERAWRCWSVTEPGVHYAYYEFPDVAAANAIGDSDALKRLVGDFNDRWGDTVQRSRIVMEGAGAFQEQ
jgi:hypothetical protein